MLMANIGKGKKNRSYILSLYIYKNSQKEDVVDRPVVKWLHGQGSNFICSSSVNRTHTDLSNLPNIYIFLSLKRAVLKLKIVYFWSIKFRRDNLYKKKINFTKFH